MGENSHTAETTSAGITGRELSSNITELPKKKAISERKKQANRENAGKSTGARTKRGKAIVAANAIKHALCASIRRFARPEERKIFEEFHKGLRRYFQPVGYLEELDVEDIALCYLKKCRAIQWEFGQEGAASVLERLASSIALEREADSISDPLSETPRQKAQRVLDDPRELVAGAAMPFGLHLILRMTLRMTAVCTESLSTWNAYSGKERASMYRRQSVSPWTGD